MTERIEKGAQVRVRMATRHRWRLAVVTDVPRVVDRWTLVPFAYARVDRGSLTLGRHDHVAQLPVDEMVIA